MDHMWVWLHRGGMQLLAMSAEGSPSPTTLFASSRAWLCSAAHDGLAIMLVLAAEPERIGGSVLAMRARIPTARFDRAVRVLAQAGLIIGYRGRTGGYALRRPPRTIALVEILDAVIPHTASGTDPLFAGFTDVVRAWLRDVTLADVLRSGERV